MASSVVRGRRDDFETVGLDNGSVRIEVAPQLGGRIVSLVRHADGFDHVYPASRPAPEAASCTIDGEALVVTTPTGTRRIMLTHEDIIFDEAGAVQYPQLVAAVDSSIVLPQSVITVDVEWSATERFSGVVTWPWASANNGDVIDLGHIDGPHLKVAERFWTTKLREGYARFVHTGVDSSLGFSFDPFEVPHLRLVINQGVGGFTVSFEPRIAKTDTAPAPLRRVRLSLRSAGEASHGHRH